MQSTITYIFPSRERPDKFFKAIENIQSFSAKEEYSIIATLDLDDSAMYNDAVKEKLKVYEKVTAYWAYSTGKVHAINLNCDKIPINTDIVILMSDDMVFIQPGFDDIIRVDMQKYFPDFDGVLHYPDSTPVQDRVITLTIMGINFFRRFNYLYHPEYVSVWADLELTEVSKKLGKYKYLPHAKIFKHEHPVWKHEKYDPLMTRNESFYTRDKEVYFRRLANNFDL